MTAPLLADRPSSLDHHDLVSLIRSVAENPAIWLPRVRFRDQERWWTRLHSDDRVDLWLITWPVGTGTDLHDHGDSAAAFTVLDGRLDEVRPDPTTGELVVTHLDASDHSIVEPGAVHDVRSPGPQRAVSIHAYSPPLSTMRFYEQAGSQLRITKTVDTDQPEADPA